MGLFQRGSKQQPEDKLEVVDESLRQETEWKPTTHQLMIMIALSVISFMVSLDACIIVTSLSVRDHLLTHPSHIIPRATLQQGPICVPILTKLLCRLLSKTSAVLPLRASGSAQHICYQHQSPCHSWPQYPIYSADRSS